MGKRAKRRNNFIIFYMALNGALLDAVRVFNRRRALWAFESAASRRHIAKGAKVNYFAAGHTAPPGFYRDKEQIGHEKAYGYWKCNRRGPKIMRSGS